MDWSDETPTLQLPVLRPDRHWRRACEILNDNGYATVKRDGQLIQRTVHYLRALRSVCTEHGIKGTIKKYPEIYPALQVSTESGRRPLEIQARTLAGQSDRTIARRVGLTAKAVTAYLGLFFEVRERLQAVPWITREVLGLHPADTPTPETLMLLYAWKQGSQVIEPWLDYLEHAGERCPLDTVIGRQRAGLHLLVNIHQLDTGDHVGASLVKKLPFLLAHLPKSRHQLSIRGLVDENLAQLLDEIRWVPPAKPADSASRATIGHPNTGSTDDIAPPEVRKNAKMAVLTV